MIRQGREGDDKRALIEIERKMVKLGGVVVIGNGREYVCLDFIQNAKRFLILRPTATAAANPNREQSSSGRS